MADLNDLQKRLNRDPELREQFFKDAPKLLAKEGIKLSKEMQAELRSLVRRMKKRDIEAGGYKIVVKPLPFGPRK